MVFSWPKGASVYYELTKDRNILDAALEAHAETAAEIMADLQARVRRGGARHDREAAAAIGAVFLHTTARPVSGIPDPHMHFHTIIFNQAFDAVENCWKAAEFSKVIANEWRYRAKFSARFARKVFDRGYRTRKNGKYWDLDAITPEECHRFSRRSQQLAELEEELRPELERAAMLAVQEAARQAKVLSEDDAYKAERANLAARFRNPKNSARLEGTALEKHWRDEFSPERMAEITPEAARRGASIGLMDPEDVKKHVLKHIYLSSTLPNF
jgi:conjugative relaxase-like TrwC/TraI family protein